jgi:hypothetical protein
MKPSRWIGTTILLAGFSITAENVSGSAITSGTINLPSFLGSGTFSLSGSGFTVAGSFVGPSITDWKVIDKCRPCSPGFSLPVDGSVFGNDFDGGSATIGATSYSVFWGDLFAAKGSAFVITGLPITVNAPGTYSSSFSFTGFLCGTDPVGSEPHPCIVDLQGLTGSGQVSVNVVQDAGGLLRSDSATYTFTSVPEPSAIVFTATAALIFLVGRKHSKRVKPSSHASQS